MAGIWITDMAEYRRKVDAESFANSIRRHHARMERMMGMAVGAVRRHSIRKVGNVWRVTIWAVIQGAN